MWGGRGARVRLLVSGTPATELFGESPSRLVLSAPPERAAELLALAAQCGLPATEVGVIGGDRLVIELGGRGAMGDAEGRGSLVSDALDVSVADLRHAWDHGLERALGEA